MDLLKELMEHQAQAGFLSDDALREIARARNVPLYRLEGLVSFYPHFRRSPAPKWRIDICRDVCCFERKRTALPRLIERLSTREDVEIHEVSCLGRCDAAPALCLNEVPLAPGTLSDADQIEAIINGKQPWPAPSFREKSQKETDSKRAWRCDPYSGRAEQYRLLKQQIAFQNDLPAHAVQQLLESGLTGRGGAGFSTGRKWQLVAAERGAVKYVICNADESEPGTFKDREILRQLPHLVIEGMVYAGLSVGAERGIIYLRHEYGPEQRILEKALEQACELGILGPDAAGSGRAFDIDIFVSPGGYILGEETALLEALEDKRGEPRNKPPFPGQHGLWGRPTLINNVETFALAAGIIGRGAEWWNSFGANGCTGLKFVCISGDVTRPGVFEVEMGTTFREVIERAGGVADGKSLKAFLPGGASSKFLPAEKVDTPIDFAAVQKAGSMLGTGAIVVFDESRDLFQAAVNVTQFFRNESCGKCVPCRIGTEKAVGLLESVQNSSSQATQLPVLNELADTLEQTSICGLGQVALVPVLSMLRQFPEEIVSASES